MTILNNAETAIRAMVNEYFAGLHKGDAARLAALFHPECILKTPGLWRSRDKWLADVSSRPVPHEAGHPWNYQIIWLELEGHQAMVKVNCPLPHGHFIDYLGLLHENGIWKIVSKMYAVKAGVDNANPKN